MYARTEGFCTGSTRKATRGTSKEKMEETRGLMQNDARASCRATELRHRQTREFSINSARKEISWDLTALDERSFQWICPFRENEGSARSLDALFFFFFFFHGTAFIPISKGICSTAACSIDPCISWRKKNWDLSFDDVQLFPLLPRESAQPAFVNFSRRNNFRKGRN